MQLEHNLVYGLASLGDRLLPTSSCSGQTQRERELEAEVASMRQEMPTQMVAFEHMRAKFEAFEKTQAAMNEFMRTAQQHEGQSSAFRQATADLPIPSTVAPMPYLHQPRHTSHGTLSVGIFLDSPVPHIRLMTPLTVKLSDYLHS